MIKTFKLEMKRHTTVKPSYMLSTLNKKKKQNKTKQNKNKITVNKYQSHLPVRTVTIKILRNQCT
jgi:hypothetical protein